MRSEVRGTESKIAPLSGERLESSLALATITPETRALNIANMAYIFKTLKMSFVIRRSTDCISLSASSLSLQPFFSAILTMVPVM